MVAATAFDGMDVSLGGSVATVWAWGGLLFLIISGRVDQNVGLLGLMGGEMRRCSLRGSMLQDQGPGRAGRWWRTAGGS